MDKPNFILLKLSVILRLVAYLMAILQCINLSKII